MNFPGWWVSLLLLWFSRSEGRPSVTIDTGCPTPVRISPCTCQNESLGLHVYCKHMSLQQVRNTLKIFEVEDKQIQNLSLELNDISSVPSRLIDGVVTFHLLVEFSNITNIDETAFDGLAGKLKILSLSANNLRLVPTHTFQKLAGLESLLLNSNTIETLHANAFAGLTALQSLDISRNRIKLNDDWIFVGLDNLENLHLGYNHLESIPSLALRNLTKLRHLNLQNNHITDVRNDSFSSYGMSLESINLQNNRINYLEVGAFKDSKSLLWLHLQDNALTHPPSEAFLYIIDQLNQLGLYGNPFKCDCHINWLKDWVVDKGKDVIDRTEDITCEYENEHDKVSLLSIHSTLECTIDSNAIMHIITSSIQSYGAYFYDTMSLQDLLINYINM